jgi:CBS domain-containing protein
MLGSMARLGELMTGAIISVAPEDTLGEAAERMAEQGVGSAVVLDGGRLIGILTERDLLGAVAGRVHTSEARVREWMTVDPVTATEDMSVDEAIRTMLERGFRHLPVVGSGRTVGIVSLRECMKAELQVDVGAEGPTD